MTPFSGYHHNQPDDRQRHHFHYFQKFKRPHHFHHWHHKPLHYDSTEYLSPVPALPIYNPNNYMPSPIPAAAYNYAHHTVEPPIYNHAHPIVQPPVYDNRYHHHHQHQHHKDVEPITIYNIQRSDGLDDPMKRDFSDVRYNQYEAHYPSPHQYPPTAQVPCGANSLIGCQPFVRAVPCYDYSHHQYTYPNYYAPAPSYSPLDVHSQPGPPYEEVNLQLAQQHIQDNRNGLNQVVGGNKATEANYITTTTVKNDNLVDQTTRFDQITTTTSRPKPEDSAHYFSVKSHKKPNTTNESLEGTIKLALEEMPDKPIKTSNPSEAEQQKAPNEDVQNAFETSGTISC